MTEKIKLVQGDTRPAIICTITDQNTGAVVSLVGATASLLFREVGSTTLQATVAGTVVDGAAGKVAFYPASAPEMLQGQAGEYEGEIEITFADGQKQTVYDPLKFKLREDF
jgi:hypothetical protein